MKKCLLLLFLVVIVVCIIYPFTLWGIGQTLFSFQANGSRIKDSENKIIGSALIAQPFTQNKYFHPRPSAANYDAMASASSSLAPSNVLLRHRVEHMLKKLAKENPQYDQAFPGDMVTTSASGLDPHITLQNALLQLDRVSNAIAKKHKLPQEKIKNEINKILDEKTLAPFNGLIGEKFVNVLEINLELHKHYGALTE